MKSILFYLLLIASFAPGYVHAESDIEPNASGWSGIVGAGIMSFSKYTGGKGMQAWGLPLISANYNEILYVDPLRANIYLASSEDKKMGLGLAVEPRTGFHSSESAKLIGMETRRNSLEGGVDFDWDIGPVAISVSYLADLTHSSKGTSSRFYFYKDFVKNSKWKLGANLGADHMSAKVTNYFFGVRADEVTAHRPLYHPGEATNFVFGFDGSCKLNQLNSLIFGLQETYLNGSAANSPIVETRWAKAAWIGLAWNLD